MDSLAKLFSKGTLKRTWRPKEVRERARMMAGARSVARMISRRNRDLLARQNRLNRESRQRNLVLKKAKKADTRKWWCRRAMRTCRNVT